MTSTHISHGNKGYFEEILKYLRKMSNEKIEVAYRVNAKICRRTFQDGISLWEFKLYSVTTINGPTVHPSIWEREMALVDRLDLGDEIFDAIKNIRNKEKGDKDMVQPAKDEREILSALVTANEAEKKPDIFKKVMQRSPTIKKNLEQGAKEQLKEIEEESPKPKLPAKPAPKEGKSLGLGLKLKQSADSPDSKTKDGQPAAPSKVGGLGAKLFGLKKSLGPEDSEKEQAPSGMKLPFGKREVVGPNQDSGATGMSGGAKKLIGAFHNNAKKDIKDMRAQRIEDLTKTIRTLE